MSRLIKIICITALLFTVTQKAICKEIQFTNPVIVEQIVSDISESQDSPNLSFDNQKYILTYHINSSRGSNIVTKYVVPDSQFTTIDQYFLCDTTLAISFPTTQLIEAKKILFYYDLLVNEPTNDTLYTQRLLLYNGDTPSEYDQNNAQTFYTQTKSKLKAPQFSHIDGRIYSEMLKNIQNITDNNKMEFFLRSLNYETAELYPPNLHYSANGKTAMIPFGDSLLTIKSWIFCTDYRNLSCDKWSTGYKAYVIFDNKIVYIHSLSENDVDNLNQLPDDVFVQPNNSDYIFALRQSKQLMRINYETMRFEEVINLTPFADGTYKKIIPIQTLDYDIVMLVDNDNKGTILRFDSQFQFVDSVSIPFEGDVSEISDFIYDQSQDMISYAYTSKLDNNTNQTRVVLQSALLDKNLIHIPPSELPAHFTVLQNYPNPFNPSTTINYELPTDGHLTVDIFNMLGQKVSTLYDQVQTAGEHFVEWNANAQSSGMYLVKMTFENQTKSIKTLLLK